MIEYNERDIDFIEDFLISQKFHDDVVYAIIPSMNDKLGLHYEIIIELQMSDTVVPKNKVIKIESLFCNFRRLRKDIRVKFYLQRVAHNKTTSSEGMCA